MAQKIKARKGNVTKYFTIETWELLPKDKGGWVEVAQASTAVSNKVQRTAPPAGDRVPSVVVNKADEAKKAAAAKAEEDAKALANAEATEARNNAILEAAELNIEVNDEMSTEDIIEAVTAKKVDQANAKKVSPEFAEAVKSAGLTRSQIKDYFDSLETKVPYSNSAKLDELVEILNEVLGGDIEKLNGAFGLTTSNNGGL